MSESEVSSTLEANKAIVTEFFDAWNVGNFDRVEELLDPNGEYWTVRARSSIPAPEMLARITATFGDTEDGMHFSLGLMTAEEDRVSLLVESDARFTGREPYKQMYHYLLRVKDGRITLVALYYDTALSNRVMRGEGGLGPLPSHAPGWEKA